MPCTFSSRITLIYKKHVGQLELLVSIKTLYTSVTRNWMWRLVVDVWWLSVKCCAPSSQSLNGSPHCFHASQCLCRRPLTSRWKTDHANHQKKRAKRKRRMETGTAQGTSTGFFAAQFGHLKKICFLTCKTDKVVMWIVCMAVWILTLPLEVSSRTTYSQCSCFINTVQNVWLVIF